MYALTYCSQNLENRDDKISVIAIASVFIYRYLLAINYDRSFWSGSHLSRELANILCEIIRLWEFVAVFLNRKVKMKYASISSLLFFSSTFFVANGFVSPHLGKPRTTTPFTDIYAAADTAVTAVDTSTTDAGTSDDMGAAAISALTKNVKTIFSLEDINKILPHRYPFLLVDKVVEYDVGKVGL